MPIYGYGQSNISNHRNTRLARKPRPTDQPATPTREAILRFISEHPGKGTKRDIARAFDVHGEGTHRPEAHPEGTRGRRLIEAPASPLCQARRTAGRAALR